jgi:hypothetical protein
MRFQLGRLERSVLLSAADGPVQINTAGDRKGLPQNRRRAAASLVRHGLATVSLDFGEDALGRSRFGFRWIELTPKGCAILARFELELASEQRIRWTRINASGQLGFAFA